MLFLGKKISKNKHVQYVYKIVVAKVIFKMQKNSYYLKYLSYQLDKLYCNYSNISY